jgi:uncharacterized protein (DUF779 family)
MNTHEPEPHLVVTHAALQAIKRLQAAHGQLMFVHSAGCCGGSAPMCFEAGEYITGPDDVLVGEVDGCPFYLDERQYTAWHTDQLILDVEPGTAEGFSLSAGGGWHFVTRSRICMEDGVCERHDGLVADSGYGIDARPAPI